MSTLYTSLLFELIYSMYLGFLVAQMVKNLPANSRDTGSIPW